MATPIRISVDDSKAQAKFRSLSSAISSATNAALNDIGEDGRAFARAGAPVYSGQTYRKITKRMNKGGEVIINATNILNDGHPRKEGRFDLTRWMHKSPRAKRHIKSGDPKFMFTTARYLRRKAPGTVRIWYDKYLRKYR